MTGIRVQHEVELLMTFHYNLGFCLEHRLTGERNLMLGAVADELNRRLPERRWEVRPVPPLPGTLAEGSTTLHGVMDGPSSTQELVEKSLDEAAMPGITLAGPVKEEVTYFDHGAGSIDLRIPLRVEAAEHITGLFQAGMGICDPLRTLKDVLSIKADWPRFCEAMLDAMEATGGLHDMWGILSCGGTGRGMTRCVAFSFLLREVGEDQPGMVLEPDALPRLFAPLTGLDVADVQDLSNETPGVNFLTEGWDGVVAIVSSAEGEEWLRFMWCYAFNTWAALAALNAYLYEQIQMLGQNRRITSKEARQMMASIRRLEQSVAVLGHEIVPDNVWDTADQRRLHQGIFDAWETAALLEGTKEKLGWLSGHSDHLNEMLSGFFQDRMNVIMTVFTFVTFAGVMADVISAVDFNGEMAAETARFFLIALGTISVLLVGVLTAWFWHRRGITEESRPRRVAQPAP